MRKGSKMVRAVGTAVVGMAVMASQAQANIGAGSARVPLTDFLIELYNVTSNVYVPLICLVVLVVGAANLAFGFLRFGPVVGRIMAVIGILGLGVTWFGQTIGANIAIAVIF